MRIWLAALCWFLGSLPAFALEAPVNLLREKDLSSFLLQLHPHRSVSGMPDQTYRFLEDGSLLVTGRAWGYLRTLESYADYHLVLEYKWGEHTWKKRADRARDAGLFFHIQAPDQAVDQSWPLGVEAQLLEGGTGGITLLQPQGIEQIRPAYRSAEWVDRKGFRGQNDIEAALGEWNRLEVLARGASLSIRLNGQTVNESEALPYRSGPLALQSEWAAYQVRRWELHPLGSFDEPWNPKEKSTNTGSGADLVARVHALSPEESLASFELDGPWEIQLVAAEPLVCDPVDVVWDDKGNLYVAEMRDYPLPSEHGPLLSRIRLLRDTDRDGLPDQANTWADELDHVQGLQPWQGGLLATTRTQILFLRDTDGDGIADHREVWFQSNEPRHNQLQISSPRWGRDNWIYLNNGLDGKEIYPNDVPDAKQAIARKNLRIHPLTQALEAVSGFGQFGATIDDWGRRFSTSNRSPVMWAHLPLSAVDRNPHAGLTAGHKDVAPSGGDSKVYPINLSHTTAAAHLGTHTAACGSGVYRGRLLPEPNGNVFVCEPTGQLVTRNRLQHEGSGLRAERVRLRPQSEFLRSHDEWFRPVNLRNGPDGALYICDMHRRFIDHSRFFPEEFSQSHYMRAGFDHGRIWRIVPRGWKPQPFSFKQDSASLVAQLDSPTGWIRDTAQRRLMERADRSVTPALEKLARGGSSLGRLHAYWTLHGLGALTLEHVHQALEDSDPRILQVALDWIDAIDAPKEDLLPQVIKLADHDHAPLRRAVVLWLNHLQTREVTSALAKIAARDFDDSWMQEALLTAGSGCSALFLQAAFEAPGFQAQSSSGKTEFLRRLAYSAGSDAASNRLELLLPAITETGGWWQYPILDGLYEGVRRYKARTKDPEALKSLPDFSALLSQAAASALSSSETVETRTATIPLLRHLPADQAVSHFEQLIAEGQPPEVREAAFAIALRLNRAKVSEILFQKWAQLDPMSRKRALEILTKSAAVPLLQKMKAGEINPALLDTMSRWLFLRSRNEEIKSLAQELFSQPSGDRASVLKTYQVALEKPGDPSVGAKLFGTNCATCHRFRGQGQQIGPDITDVRNKPRQALLSDILDPNRMIEARWTAHAVQTRDGRALLGLIEAETAASITLRGPGFVETLSRDQITQSTELGQSLMPVGFEGALNPEQMAHLLAYLKQ